MALFTRAAAKLEQLLVMIPCAAFVFSSTTSVWNLIDQRCVWKDIIDPLISSVRKDSCVNVERATASTGSTQCLRVHIIRPGHSRLETGKSVSFSLCVTKKRRTKEKSGDECA